MRGRKAVEFARLRASLVAGGHAATGDYNNARLVAVTTYERCVPALRAELDRVGNDLPAFYAAMRDLDAAGRRRREALSRTLRRRSGRAGFARLNQVLRRTASKRLRPDAEPGEAIDLADAVDESEL